jgi:hypothetical protein
MRPFEIQGAGLILGGVQLEAGTTGVVIPGVTQATSFKVDEVQDTGDQTRTFSEGVVAVDYVLYQEILAGRQENLYADYIVELDDEGHIDNIEVQGRGTYDAGQAMSNDSNDMYAYIGSGNPSDRPIDPNDWVQIPFRAKMRPGAVETIGGGNGGASRLEQLDDVDLSDPTDGQALVWDSNDEVWKNQTISGGGGSTDTGNITFNVTELRSPTDSNVGWDNGVISLMPGAESDDGYITRGQYLNIYPTNAEDAPHIHIAAGMNTETSQLGDLILGNDSQHIDINGGGNILIKTNNQSHEWTFGMDGLLSTTEGNDFRMRSSGAGSTSIEYVGSVEDVTPYRTKIAASSSAATIRTSGDVNIWSFNEYGNLVLPAGGTITDTNGTNLLTQSVPDHLQNGQYAVTLGSEGTLTAPGFVNLNYNGDQMVSIGTGPGGASIIANTGKSLIIGTDGYSKSWIFNTDGSIQFPDNSVQRTAYNYAPQNLVNLDGGIASTEYPTNYVYVDGGGSYIRGILTEDIFDGEDNGATPAEFDKVLNGGGA